MSWLHTHLQQQTLGQQLLGPPTRLDVDQAVVGVSRHALPEGAQSQLYHGPIIHDLKQAHTHVETAAPSSFLILSTCIMFPQCTTSHLSWNISSVDVVLQMGHQHQVPRQIPPVNQAIAHVTTDSITSEIQPVLYNTARHATNIVRLLACGWLTLTCRARRGGRPGTAWRACERGPSGRCRRCTCTACPSAPRSSPHNQSRTGDRNFSPYMHKN